MSQYSRPLAVLVGSPVTLVGPLPPTVLSAGTALRIATLANASNARARITTTVFIIPLFLRLGSLSILSLQVSFVQAKAIASISTRTSFGSRATSTVERAGGA